MAVNRTYDGLPELLGRDDVAAYLTFFDYSAIDADMWADPEGFDGIPELVMRVTRNEKVSSATYYEIDAALHARGSKEPFLKWTCMRTLAILRVHIHDLVERNLGSEVYKKHFKGTPFAARGGFSGTTARLDAWFKTCGICASLALLRPKVIADILTLLEAPTNANDRLQDWYNESAPSGRVNARPEPRTPEESPEASDEEGETAVADINLQILHKTGDPLISFSVEPCATGSAVKEALGQYLGQGEEIETLLCENGKVFEGGQLASSLSLNSSGVCVLRVVLRGIVLPAARTSDDAENDSAEAAKVEAARARDQQVAREASDREAAEAAERQAARVAERERLAKVAADREAAEIAEQEAADGEAAEREAAEASERARLAQEAAEQKAAEAAEREAAEDSERARLAQEAAEQEAAEAAEREAAAAAESERLAQETADRGAAEAAEQEAAAAAERERLAQEAAEQEAAEREAAEAAERERLVQEAAEREAVESAERERLAQENSDREAVEAADPQAADAAQAVIKEEAVDEKVAEIAGQEAEPVAESEFDSAQEDAEREGTDASEQEELVQEAAVQEAVEAATSEVAEAAETERPGASDLKSPELEQHARPRNGSASRISRAGFIAEDAAGEAEQSLDNKELAQGAGYIEEQEDAFS